MAKEKKKKEKSKKLVFHFYNSNKLKWADIHYFCLHYIIFSLKTKKEVYVWVT